MYHIKCSDITPNLIIMTKKLRNQSISKLYEGGGKNKEKSEPITGSDFCVEHRGFEPLASTMRMSRATNCANAPNIPGEF